VLHVGISPDFLDQFDLKDCVAAAAVRIARGSACRSVPSTLFDEIHDTLWRIDRMLSQSWETNFSVAILQALDLLSLIQEVKQLQNIVT
jgi:hypothetical protein